MPTIEEIKTLLSREFVFRCQSRSGENESKDIPIMHKINDPLISDEKPEWATPSLSELYKHFNGLKLFMPVSSSVDINEGFYLYDKATVLSESENIKEIFSRNSHLYTHDNSDTDFNDWLDGLIPIAEVMGSGDRFVLDTVHREANGECPILYLDHELYYGDGLSPEFCMIVASDAYELLISILNKPLKYLSPYWIGGDYLNQWFPKEAILANQS